VTAATRTVISCWRAPSGWIYTLDSDRDRKPWSADENDPALHRYLLGHGLTLGAKTGPSAGGNITYELVPADTCSPEAIRGRIAALVARIDNLTDDLKTLERDGYPTGFALEDSQAIANELGDISEMVNLVAA
jgi:hypothetical protein